jgi:predicted nucleic acid-binding protein
MNKTILVDANAFFYIIKNKPNVEALYSVLDNYEFVSISALSLFFVETKLLRSKGTDKNLLHQYMDRYRDFVAGSDVLDLTDSTIKQADKIVADFDWEDAVQVATALGGKCDAVLTCDEAFRDGYNKIIKVEYVPKS